MAQSLRTITMKGQALTLEGTECRVGDRAPDCELITNDLIPVRLTSFRGKVCVIASVPSLDTPVCDTEAQRFNKEVSSLSKNVSVLAISMDLPFAQKRWCGAAGVDRIQTLSDHRSASFGKAFGVLIADLRLLARAVFVLDREGTVRYVQLVPELTNEPMYEPILAAVQKLV